MAVLDKAFKDFHTLDEIFDFEPTLNDDARILEWANPMRALPATFINFLKIPNGLKLQLALRTLESPPKARWLRRTTQQSPLFVFSKLPSLYT
jgi:hypothetical protein